ncbi:MAG: hypothetical protein KKC39_00950 [Candidatus Omnitrophica bacterium]|nr:hypothetical protein [Candidatus Omnitrophota bacterium]
MKEDKFNWSNFLKYFITEDKFLQNPLLDTDDFIKFCAERGVKTREEELEFFEKEGLLYPVARINVPIEEDERLRFRKNGKEFWRPAGFALQEGEELVEKYVVKRYVYQNFREGYKENLLKLLEKGDLFHPSEKAFQKWESFKSERLENGNEEVQSFYSSFQIYALEQIKIYSHLKFPFRSYKISLNEAQLQEDSISEAGVIPFKVNMDCDFNPRRGRNLTDDEYNKCLETRIDFFKNDINWEVQKRYLSERSKDLDDLLRFFLLVQSVYIPYMKSGSRTIQLLNIEDKDWQELKSRFDCKFR